MLELSNIITVSVSVGAVGLANYNVNNLALFTTDGVPTSWGTSADYGAYASLSAVGIDFGTGSETYKQAQAVFSQSPNILTAGGTLLVYAMGTKALIDSVNALKAEVFFCGIISTSYPASGSMKTLADSIQALSNKILFLPSNQSSDIAGAFTDIKAASDYNTRCLYYSSATSLNCRLMAAAYASRALSVNFSGSNTALTMNLKQLAGISPDEGVTQTILGQCATAGVDVYADIAGISGVISYGANKFFDEIYNLIWFVTQIQVTGFNFLQGVGGKVPQTEPGMSLLKSAYRSICQQAVNNGYIAPGTWTGGEWFGNQQDMANNIANIGYYIYSAPVNLQSVSDRQARKAPLVQIAVKESGAIHSTSLVVNVNP